MPLQDMVAPGTAACRPDVDKPQVGRLGRLACQSMDLWAIVHKGRTQATLTSAKGMAQSTSRQEKWSRGCRAPRLPFWHFAWLPLWQLAPRKPKKLFTLMTALLSPPSRPIPANTSKTIGRVCRAIVPAPALFLSVVNADPAKQPMGTTAAWASDGPLACAETRSGPANLAFSWLFARRYGKLWLFQPKHPIAGGTGNRGGWACASGVILAAAARMTWGQIC